MLQVERISKNYQHHSIFQHFSFTVQPGEIVGIVGENGAGKSTLLRMLATLTKPTSGSISLFDHSYTHPKVVRPFIGFVPQELSIWEELSVEDNMKFFSKLSWKPRSIDECHELCTQMQLTEWKKRAASLSGGTKRKLNLAISLIHDPELLLLDEPTVGIDMRSKEEIGKYLYTLAKQQQKMILLTSHDIHEIASYCDRVLLIGTDPYYAQTLKKLYPSLPLEHLAEGEAQSDSLE